jgi:hypothetical protein
MLTKIRNPQGNLMTLQFDDASSGIIVEDVGGLDPVKATLVSQTVAQVDGAQFSSARRDPRNITMRLALEPDYITTSVAMLRASMYQFLMPKAPVELRFYDDGGLIVNASGMVESFEAPLFVSEPEAVLSIICFDPDFIALEATETDGFTVSDSTATLYTYDGTTETGIQLVLSVDRSLSDFTIYHTAPDGSVKQLDFAAALVADDVLTLTTIRGSKGAMLHRGTSDISLLYGVTTPNWIQLSQGDNYLRVFAEGAAIPYTITYTTRYGGL